MDNGNEWEEDWMWEVGVGMAAESNGEKMGTTVIEQQLKKKKPDRF